MITKDQICNSKFEVMTLGATGAKIETRVAPMSRAIEWCDKAQSVFILLSDAMQITDPVEQRTAINGMLPDAVDCVIAYDDTWNGDAIREHATYEQIINAMYLLQERTDPLMIAQARQLETLKKQMEPLQALGLTLPGELLSQQSTSK